MKKITIFIILFLLIAESIFSVNFVKIGSQNYSFYKKKNNYELLEDLPFGNDDYKEQIQLLMKSIKNYSLSENIDEIRTKFRTEYDGSVTSLGISVDSDTIIPIYSPVDGEIIEISYDSTALQKYVVIKEFNSDAEIIFGNIKELEVFVGKKINAGDFIGNSAKNNNKYNLKILTIIGSLYIDPIILMEIKNEYESVVLIDTGIIEYINDNLDIRLLSSIDITENDQVELFYKEVIKEIEIVYPFEDFNVNKKNIDFMDYVYDSNRNHLGIDYQVEKGEDILSIFSGKVVNVHYDFWSAGLSLIIYNKSGYYIMYGHLSEIEVNEGDFVRKGQFIGKSGDTGYTKEPSLLIGIFIDDFCINPDLLFDQLLN